MKSTIFLIFLVAYSSAQAIQEIRKCGLPDNYTELPDFAQEELRAVWKNYVPGKNCDHELLITDDILAVLEMFENEDGKSGTSTTAKPPSTEEKSAEATEQGPNNTEDLESSPEVLPESIPKTLVFPTLSPSTPETSTVRAYTSRTKTRTTTAASRSDEEEEPVATYVSRRTTTTLRTTPEEYYDSEEITTTPKPRPLKPKRRKHKTNRPPLRQSIGDEDEVAGNFQDIRGPHIQESQKLPFLKNASPDVVAEFTKVLLDNNIPSEERRQEEIHLLAVSLLNSKQLLAFNAWSTNQRKRLRDQQGGRLPLSRDARDALRSLSALDSAKQRDFVRSIPKDVRLELRRYTNRASKRLAAS